MRLILMGTGPFAVPTFQTLLEAATHEVVAIISRPPTSGKGRKQASVSPVIELARRCARPVWTPHDINDGPARRQLDAYQADLMVVCDYGQILAAETLATTQLGGVNLHGSLLPRYRGAAPVNWAIWNGEQETGISVIHMTPRLDAGPILAVRRTPIAPSEDAVQLEQRLARLGIEGVQDALALLAEWDGHRVIGIRQDPAQATSAPRLKKADGNVNWSHSAQRIRNQVRAFKPWPGTFTTWNRDAKPMRLILNEVTVVDSSSSARDFGPGEVVRSDPAHLWVATGDGLLAVESIQPAGKRALTITEFLRGYALSEGMQLGNAPTGTP